MKYLWVYLWTQNKNIEIPGRIFFVFINVATVEGRFVDTNRDTRKYSDNYNCGYICGNKIKFSLHNIKSDHLQLTA